MKLGMLNTVCQISSRIAADVLLMHAIWVNYLPAGWQEGVGQDDLDKQHAGCLRQL